MSEETLSSVFSVKLSVRKESGEMLDLPALGACVSAWDDQSSGAVDFDDDDSGEDYSDEEQSEDEDTADVQGDLVLDLVLTPAALAEYMAVKDEIFDYSKIVITYSDSEGKPVFAHVYEGGGLFYMVHTSGTQTASNRLFVQLTFDYIENEQFAVPDPEPLLQ